MEREEGRKEGIKEARASGEGRRKELSKLGQSGEGRREEGKKGRTDLAFCPSLKLHRSPRFI